MKNKGITLISLVITIVILIILASVGIYLSLGNNGIFTRAKQANETTNKQTATEIINLKITNCQINKYAEEQRMPTLKELSLELKEDGEIEYVMKESQVAGTKKYDVGENPSSIYTKLSKYPYEFEINSSLQLASINGVKVAKIENNSIDYSESKNEVILTKTIHPPVLDWLENIEGPEIEAGTWLIWIGICSTDETNHTTQLSGKGCFTNESTTVYAGINNIMGYYKGEKTKLTAKMSNLSTKDREYNITFKALKLSDTY